MSGKASSYITIAYCKTGVNKMDINETSKPFWNKIMYKPPLVILLLFPGRLFHSDGTETKNDLSPIRFLPPWAMRRVVSVEDHLSGSVVGLSLCEGKSVRYSVHFPWDIWNIHIIKWFIDWMCVCFSVCLCFFFISTIRSDEFNLFFSLFINVMFIETLVWSKFTPYTAILPELVSKYHRMYSGNSLTRASWELVFKYLLSELRVIQQSFNVKFHLGTKRLLLVIRNPVLPGYVFMSCHCIILFLFNIIVRK